EPWPDPHARGAVLAARTFSTRSASVPDWVGVLDLIEDFAATWDDPEHARKRAGDAIHCRDGYRCSAPGCTSRENLEDHHLVYRSRGGTNDRWNRLSVCRHHH